MRNYIKIKRAEWKLKAMLYGSIAAFMENKQDIFGMLQSRKACKRHSKPRRKTCP